MEPGSKHPGLAKAALLAALAVSAFAGSAAAQTSFAGGTVSGHLDVGGRTYAASPSGPELGKFAEYRDVSPGLYVPLADLRFTPLDEGYTVEFGGLQAGRADQRLLVHAYRPGAFDVQLAWDQIPHVFSTTGRLLVPESDGVFPLPDPRPPPAAFNTAPRIKDIDLRWDAARAAVKLTPTPEWDLRAEYTHTAKDGVRPIGMAFGSPGNNFREVLEPIDQTVHDLRFLQAYATSRYQVQFAYNLSVFGNDFDSFVADNPLVAVDTPNAGPARGRTALAPDNLAHTFALSGGVNLPLRSRIAGLVSYGIRRQDEAFLPHTINPLIVAPDTAPGVLALPRETLDGDVRTLLLNLTGSIRPLPSTTVSARYRLYDFDDQTDAFVIPGRVVNDRSLSIAEHESHRYAFRRHNATLDLRWHPVRIAQLKLSYGFEGWDRERELREVETTSEHTPRLTFDVTPYHWLMLRAAYSHAWRDGDPYVQVAEAQPAQLRKFDMGDRERDRAELLAQVMPLDQVAFTTTFGVGDSDYDDSPLGVQDDSNWLAGADVTWAVHPRLSVFGSYTWEEYELRQRSRYREPPGQLDNPTFDWIGRGRDDIQTIGLGLEASVIPAKVDAGARWDYSRADWRLLAYNPVTPAGGTEAQLRSATAVDFPDLENLYRSFEGFLRYRAAERWAATLRFTYEHFSDREFRTDRLLPATGQDIFLGNDFRDYTAGYFTLFLTYDFGSVAAGPTEP